MKKKLAINLLLFLAVQYASAFTYTWNPTVTGNIASTALNWSPTGVPGGADDVVFDGSNSGDCNWDLTAVNSLSLVNSYSGNVNILSSSLTFSGNLVINSGTLHAGACTLDFTETTSGLFIQGSTGFFDAGFSTVILELNPAQVFNFSGSLVLKTLTVVGKGQNGSRDINFGTNLTTDIMHMSVGQKVHSYQGTIHIKQVLDVGANVFAVAYITVPPNNTANFIFDGNQALISGVSNVNKAPLPNFEMNTSGTYTIVDNLNIYGNWTATQGTLVPGNSAVNIFGNGALISGTAAAFNDLEIQSGAFAFMPPNAEVKIGGTLTRSGILFFPPTTALGLNGTGAQTISGPSLTLAGLIAYGGGTSRNVTISTPVNILDSLKVGNLVTFNSGGNVTLKSFSSLTARVAEIGTAGSITGNVKVETVVPGGSTGWSVMGVRGVNSQSVASWDTYASSGGTNGIPMTCVNCFYDPSVLSPWFESIQGWDETTLYGYDTNIVAGTPLTPGKGFWVYIGDGPVNTNDLKLINTGSLITGPVVVPVTSGILQSGFNLVANPYPSPISWALVMANSNNTTTVKDAIYAFNPDIGQTSYVSGATNPGSGAPTGIDDIIAGGQGFYVEAKTNGNLNFTENMKAPNNTSANPLLRTASKNNVGKLFRLHLQGKADWYATTFRIHDDATSLFDNKLDAKQFFDSPGYAGYPGPYTKYTTISSQDDSGLDYAIQSLPPMTASVSIPVLVRVSGTGTYTISARDFKDFEMCVGLIDKIDNSYHDLRSAPYVFNMSDTTSAPRFEVILCSEAETDPTSINQADRSAGIIIGQDSRGVFVKTAFEKNTRAVISTFNLLGEKITDDIVVEGMVNNTSLPLKMENQIVIIKVVTESHLVTKKVLVN
jgi:hypothetical protein